MKRVFLLMFVFFMAHSAFSQVLQTKKQDSNPKKIKIYLGEDSKHYLSIGLNMQFWYRYAELNPGSLDKNTNEIINTYSDFSLRRMRISASYVSGNHTFYTQFGLTNEASYNFLSKGIIFNDFWYKYQYAPKHFIGAGKHMWNGLSRITNMSSGAIMSVDGPAFNFPNVNVDNDFNRQIGLFLNGQLGKIDYHISVNKPYQSTTSSGILNEQEILEKSNVNHAYNTYHDNFTSKAYISYSILNSEKVAATPFKKMSYFGKKGKFLTLGLGYQHNPEASAYLSESDVVVKKDQLALSMDLWFEMPLKNNSAFNFYSALFYYDFGPNYLRSSGVMNGFSYADPGQSLPQGAGISHYYFGSGKIAYAIASYVLPETWFGSTNKIVPFAALTYKNLDGLNDDSFSVDAGANYHFAGDNLKLGVQYSNRPLYEAESLELVDYKSLFILQLQAKF